MATFGNFAKRKVPDRTPGAESGVDDADAGSLEAAALPDDLIEVGVIVDAYGVKGWVKVQPHAQEGQGGDALVRARGWWLAPRIAAPGQPVGGAGASAAGAQGALRGYAVSQAKPHSGSVVAHLNGFADRDQALAAKGSAVHVRRADFAKLDRDEFYWVDLIGLAVVNGEGDRLGQVVGLIDNGAHSVMRVAPSEDARASDERLIPFVDAYVRSVDFDARQVVVDWGLDY
ncbi:ribosome maturation factor RimM [Pararobbsia silviterrae]|uniref:Ribosome maturation factor RimM n=1 Tax=Pararobbsia silviterrae TaxID=1792498 RepID=A0A494YAS0_9BURK|nr:ribosome maturation factor RimM [Pararobbsia silviterrae]RKP59265.1 ribosome maturation factor RimM [Pararobbsia silviterrae]